MIMRNMMTVIIWLSVVWNHKPDSYAKADDTDDNYGIFKHVKYRTGVRIIDSKRLLRSKHDRLSPVDSVGRFSDFHYNISPKHIDKGMKHRREKKYEFYLTYGADADPLVKSNNTLDRSDRTTQRTFSDIYTGCMYKGVARDNGSEWTDLDDPCTVMSCKAGVATVTQKQCITPCQQLYPSKPVTCCSPCPNTFMINTEYLSTVQIPQPTSETFATTETGRQPNSRHEDHDPGEKDFLARSGDIHNETTPMNIDKGMELQTENNSISDNQKTKNVEANDSADEYLLLNWNYTVNESDIITVYPLSDIYTVDRGHAKYLDDAYDRKRNDHNEKVGQVYTYKLTAFLFTVGIVMICCLIFLSISKSKKSGRKLQPSRYPPRQSTYSTLYSNLQSNHTPERLRVNINVPTTTGDFCSFSKELNPVLNTNHDSPPLYDECYNKLIDDIRVNIDVPTTCTAGPSRVEETCLDLNRESNLLPSYDEYTMSSFKTTYSESTEKLYPH